MIKTNYKDYLHSLKLIFKLSRSVDFKLTYNLFFAWLKSVRSNAMLSHSTFLKRKNSLILAWLNKKYGDLVPAKFTFQSQDSSDLKPNKIWVFWYQGEKAMPELVQLCYKSICHYAGTKEVILLTKDNISKFVNIPDFITDKVSNGIITLTHFSDIVRVCLLHKYGGLWMDATLFVTDYINFDNLNPLFESIKIHPKTEGEISNYRWAGFFLYSLPGSEAMACFRNIMFKYWENPKHNYIIDYLFIDFTFEMLYSKNQYFRNLIDSKPYQNDHIYDLYDVLNDNYDEHQLDEWRDTTVYKFNRRFIPLEGSTFYHHFKNISNV